MEEVREGEVAIKAIAAGVYGAVHHYILAVMIEKNCERKDAVADALALLERIKDSIQKSSEVDNGHP